MNPRVSCSVREDGDLCISSLLTSYSPSLIGSALHPPFLSLPLTRGLPLTTTSMVGVDITAGSVAGVVAVV